MWTIRFLNGPLAGQVVPMSKSPMFVGRAATCDIRLATNSISKEHCQFETFDDKLIISDLGSRNGTFVNGVQVRSTKLRSGDKIAFHDIFVEVQKVPEAWANRLPSGPYTPGPHMDGGAAPRIHHIAHVDPNTHHLEASAHHDEHAPEHSVQRVGAFFERIQEYAERVVLPGIYHLPENMEFKWVMAGFMALFIVLVTTLSTIPLVRILKASLEEESQQHAMTIATTLARVNAPQLAGGQESSASVEIATSRPGVTKAFILTNVDGSVVAPARESGAYPEIPYVHEGRKLTKESVKQVDDSTIVAMVPIQIFNQSTGGQSISHWAVVFYDMSSLAVDNAQVVSLFITTLFISLALGLILFYFLYKLVEHPIRSINSQLDVALKEGHDSVQVSYNFPALQLLVANISSALNRTNDGAAKNAVVEHDRNREIANLVELVGFAALGIRAQDLTIAAVNQALESRLGAGSIELSTMTINELSDQALKLSIKDLIERVDKNPDEMASNELEFSGINFQVVAQGVYGATTLAYYLIVLLPMDEEDQ